MNIKQFEKDITRNLLKVHRQGNVGRKATITREGVQYSVQLFNNGVYEGSAYHHKKSYVKQYAKELKYDIVYDFSKTN